MRSRFVKDYRNPILQQTSNGIVILRERLSWLRQDNFVSLARRRFWGAQAASLQPSAACRRRLGGKSSLACKEAFRQAAEKNRLAACAPQNHFAPPKAKQLPLIVAAQRSLVVKRRRQNVTVA